MRKAQRDNAKEQEKLDKARTLTVSPIAREMWAIYAKYADQMLFAEDFVEKRDLSNALSITIATDVLNLMRTHDLQFNNIIYTFQCFKQIIEDVEMKVQEGVGASLDYIIASKFGIPDLEQINFSKVEEFGGFKKESEAPAEVQEEKPETVVEEPEEVVETISNKKKK